MEHTPEALKSIPVEICKECGASSNQKDFCSMGCYVKYHNDIGVCLKHHFTVCEDCAFERGYKEAVKLLLPCLKELYRCCVSDDYDDSLAIRIKEAIAKAEGK